MEKYTLLIGCVLLLVIIAVLALRPGRSAISKVKAKPLMTSREREVFAMIEQAAPQYRVHAQVALGALLQPLLGLNKQERARARNSYSQKIVDYVLEDRLTGAVIALIELDDRTHDVSKDSRRDALTQAAGYRTLRLPTGRLSGSDVGGRLQALLVPTKVT
jgi:very-short-patch-repair endonuclease